MKRILLLLPLLLAAFLCGCVTNGQIQNYNSGVKAYEAKDFETAKACFLGAGDYGNSRSYLSAIEEYERIYKEALAFFEARNYPAARNSFLAISEFGNSREYVDFIDRLAERYDQGLEAFSQGDYVGARNRFRQAMGYSDADDYVKRISRFEDSYQLAMGYYGEGDYASALASFEKIGVPYKDSEQKIASIYEYFSRKGITPTLLRSLFNESCEAEGEDYSLPITDMNETGFAWRTTNGLLIMGNTDESGFISTVSFWLDKDALRDLGEEQTRRLFAHCIHSLTSDETSFSSILDSLDSYLEGAKQHGGFSILLDEDDSGAEVLTCSFTGN